MNAEFPACGISGWSSVRAIRIANCAPFAPEMNHLWPFTTQLSPSRTARVWMSVGSEPGDLGLRHREAGADHPVAERLQVPLLLRVVAQWRRVCMLPSSGACAFSANGPNADFPPPPRRPPSRRGRAHAAVLLRHVGSQSPHSRAATRISMIDWMRKRRSPSRAAIFSSAVGRPSR
jgi:hypothetical protein